VERIPQSDLTALKERAARHAKEFCTELFPDGRLSRTGGYWIVEDFRISLSSGLFWSVANYSKRRKGDILTLWMIAKKLMAKIETKSGPSLDAIRSRLASYGSGYQFRDSESFRQGVESFIEWLDERFPVRSDLHEVIGWDS
jgi:hypothetical protein